MKKTNDNWITGTARTNKAGSECTFQICTREEWDEMTEKEREDAVTEAMHDSGVVEYFPNV